MALSEQELQIMERLAGIPEAREDLKQIVGKHMPDVVPDYKIKEDIRKEFQAAYEKQQKELEEMKEAQKKRDLENSWEKESAKIKRQLGWDEIKLSEFQKAFGEEFKDGKGLEMYDLAEYYDLKHRPLNPASNPKVGPFGLRHDQASNEAQWRQDKNDAKSPMFSKNKRERKAYWRGQWAKAKEDMLANGIR